MDGIDKGTGMVRINVLVNTVAEIKDMPGTMAEPGKDRCHLVANAIR